VKSYTAFFLGLFGFLFAGFIGLWSKSLFTQSESIHFSVNFPAGLGVKVSETMPCCDLGGPWANIPSQEWSGYPSGGVLVWGREGCVLLDVGREGFLKRTFQPRMINLSTHWLRNVGTQPYQIRLQMDLCGIEAEWQTHESAWDLATKTTTREIEPGEVFNMDWNFNIPPEMWDQKVICEGQLTVFDAQSGKALTELPVTLINSRTE